MDTVHEPEIAPILIIEDDVGLSTLIKDIVNDMGLSTLQAFNGSSAMDILQKQPIELMLLDFSLPDISGMQILDTIREEELYMPPFIVITGTGDEQLAVEMMKTGAYDYLTKDAHFLKSIPAVINFALREKDAQRKLEFAEKALHESEAYNKILFQESSIPMAVLDPVSLQFVDSNKAGANIFHIESPEQLLGKTMLDVSASTQQENKTSKEHFLTYIQQARNEDSVRFQWRCQYSDGSKWDAELLLVAIHYKNRELMQFSLQDITEKLAKEKNKTLSELQRRQSQKMEAIGVLTGGIAHEFNNLLAPIIGFSELLMIENPNDKRLSHINSAGHRAKDMVTQLLAYGQRSIATKKAVAVDDLIVNTMNFLKNTLAHNIDICWDIEYGLQSVLGVTNDLRQIIYNLSMNASNAMPDGGTITLTLKKAQDHKFISLTGGEHKGNYICLSIQDTGKGIKKSSMSRIFDPFFTTSEVGQGSGLGLSVVQGIVEQHDGYIRVDSIEGAGSTFHVYLPVIEDNAISQSKDNAPLHKRSENILLIDNEVYINNLIKSMLEPMGYTVLDFLDSEKALKEFSEHAEKYDLVITDYSIPRINGKDLTEWIRKIHSDIPIILTASYDNFSHGNAIDAWDMNALLMKPFEYTELRNTVINLFKEC